MNDGEACDCRLISNLQGATKNLSLRDDVRGQQRGCLFCNHFAEILNQAFFTRTLALPSSFELRRVFLHSALPIFDESMASFDEAKSEQPTHENKSNAWVQVISDLPKGA
ncbi:hypothetical protein AC630_06000 [Bradyrhizobium sp. AS23.2]|nr:hypothetical protein AC630_06000 [Bradyrhizobium sp. AS23.2]